LGFGKDDDLGRDELDDRLARECSSFSALPSLIHKKIIEHARYIYTLQHSPSSPSPSSAESDSESWDSDSDAYATHSHSRKRRVAKPKKRMSLLTGQYYSVPHPPPHSHSHSHSSHLENENNANGIGNGNGNGKSSARRRFFQSGATWDVGVERVLVGSGMPIPSVRVVDVGRVMEGGGGVGVGTEGVDEGWDGQEGEGEEGSMVVDT
jgi:histone deacetylase 1/2